MIDLLFEACPFSGAFGITVEKRKYRNFVQMSSICDADR